MQELVWQKHLCGLGKKDGLDKVLTELKAQGRNLNQLTTLANMGKSTMVYGDRLAESYQQINEQLCRLLREVSKGPPQRAGPFVGRGDAPE